MEQLGAETTDILSSSRKMQAVLASIRRVAAADVPVLLVGEKGTGKRLAARAIHQLSPRKEGPFTVVNCASVPKDLIEVEFFGHEKGAFTGAYGQRKGAIELSHGGSIFLNDIDTLPLPLQTALVRYLEEKSVTRVGARDAVTADTRIIAATDKDLKQGMREGKFPDDLFFAFVIVAIPPLRDRTEDILPLAQAFLRKFADEKGKRLTAFLVSAEDAMMTYSWPGNVRELENRVRRAVVMAEGLRIRPDDLELSETCSPHQPHRPTLKESREALEREMITAALARWKGNVTRAAEELDVSRPTLYELMVKLGIPRL